jgi:phosphoserine phosphatase
MTRPFAVFDIDGTIFRSSLLIEVVEALIYKGIFPPGANSKIQPALMLWHDRATPDAYIDYLQEVIHAFEDNIRGVTEAQLRLVSEDVISKKFKQTYVFTRDLINQLKDTHELFAISGSPKQLVENFASAYGFTDFVATEYQAVDGVFDGTANKAHSKKDKILDQLVQKHGLNYAGQHRCRRH